MDEPQDLFLYWGKTSKEPDVAPCRFHLLPYHCLDVAAVGEFLLNSDPYLCTSFGSGKIVNPASLIPLICYHLALHDIGKFSERFQSLVPDLYDQLQKRKPVSPYSIHHGELGYYIWLNEVWNVAETNDLFGDPSVTSTVDKEAFVPWIKAVMGHHGTPPGTPSAADNPKFHFSEDNRIAIRDFAQECGHLFIKRPVFSSDLSLDEYDRYFKQTSWVMAGLVTLCDWIASDPRYFAFYPNPLPLEEYWQTIALPSAQYAVTEIGILPTTVSPDGGMAGLFPQYSAHPSPLQSYIEKIPLGQGPHLVIIEESTGGGKTEAALILAHRMMQDGLGEGIFMGLPTMATANAMYDRLYTAYDRIFSPESHPSLVLAHGSRNLVPRFQSSIGLEDQPGTLLLVGGEETASAQCTAWLADNRKKALLASVGIGTIDQALLAVLPKRHQSLRLLGLSRNILIVDEVHAYDTYTNELLKNLLHFHAAFGGSAILLSATLPERMRNEFIGSFLAGCNQSLVQIPPCNDYPLITHVTPTGIEYLSPGSEQSNRKTVRVVLVERFGDVVEMVVERLMAGMCVCWIRNTVADAIDAYQLLCQRVNPDKITLFHARFVMGDRLDKERMVLKHFGKTSTDSDRTGRVVIATQVVEQSLDIDFDFMVSDLAPVDLIIQRAGRLHRHNNHGERGEATLAVYTPPLTADPRGDWHSRVFPRGTHVYPRSGELWLTAQILARKGEFTLPDDARELIEGVYSADSDHQKPPALQAVDHRDDTANRRDRAFAQFNALQFNDGYSLQQVSQWGGEMQVPTRLGENTILLRLGYWDGETIRPLYNKSDHPWEMSQVACPEYRINGPDNCPPGLELALQEAIATMPDRGRWSILVPVVLDSDQQYT
ncbi:CRISPR-associated helicase Cas3', partial [Methanoregula sp.]|uniref:CRISPR-associated helicase Cas3' n=1 Tax=Methanoregula sp. TaxID=2052170 RepID=UPI0025ED04CC